MGLHIVRVRLLVSHVFAEKGRDFRALFLDLGKVEFEGGAVA